MKVTHHILLACKQWAAPLDALISAALPKCMRAFNDDAVGLSNVSPKKHTQHTDTLIHCQSYPMHSDIQNRTEFFRFVVPKLKPPVCSVLVLFSIFY